MAMQLDQGHARYRSASAAGPVDPAIMDADQRAIPSQPDVAFDGIRPVLQGLEVGRQAVFGLVLIGSAMGDHLRYRSIAMHAVSMPARFTGGEAM